MFPKLPLTKVLVMKPFPKISGILNAAPLTRRTFLKSSAAAASTTMLPFGQLAQGQDQKPHFLLTICISGGMDAAYLWDARSLKMTDQNKIQNYLYKNPKAELILPDPSPIQLTGVNGGTTLRTALTNGLMKYQSDLTILNGVTMLTNGFVGHGNNMYYLFSNSPNPGRDSFVPLIGSKGKRPLDSVHIGGFEGDGNGPPTNFGGSIQLFQGQGGGLANVLKNGPTLELQSPLMKHVMARLAANAQGEGMFNIGSKKMESAVGKVPALAETLKSVNASTTVGNENEIESSMNIALAYFKGGVTSAITIMYDKDPVLDTHDSFSASEQPNLFKTVALSLERSLDMLKNTPYDAEAGLSFFDVTTVMITSEFSRTMKNGDTPETSGTDHNPLTNTIVLAGKGIKGGQVIGASDLTDVSDTGELLNVSGAHKQLESGLNQIMGRPFDFDTMMPRTDLPETFVETDYLTFPSVANTLMEMFGVPSQDQFRLGSVQAKLLKGVLK